jgi:regulation of enolase protein 1 (concanavalin A-like superfamily)
MTRNAPLEDNTPIQSGLMAASPDRKGFEARFENFTVKISSGPAKIRMA